MNVTKCVTNKLFGLSSGLYGTERLWNLPRIFLCWLRVRLETSKHPSMEGSVFDGMAGDCSKVQRQHKGDNAKLRNGGVAFGEVLQLSRMWKTIPMWASD